MSAVQKQEQPAFAWSTPQTPNEPKRPDQCHIDHTCLSAFHFLGQYAKRCAPAAGGDTSYTLTPTRIDSIDANGVVSHDWRLQGKEWLENWRAINPQEAPEQFLLNRCAHLAETDPEKGSRCKEHVTSIAETFFRRPMTLNPQERYIAPLSNRRPLDHLFRQCQGFRTPQEDQYIKNPPMFEFLKNAVTGTKVSERMESLEGRCKRDVSGLKSLLGNFSVVQLNSPPPPATR